jgi:hypothetical protein
VVWDVLDHSEPLRTGWLLLMMLLMVYVIMVTPYLVAFSISTVSPSLLVAAQAKNKPWTDMAAKTVPQEASDKAPPLVGCYPTCRQCDASSPVNDCADR